MESANNVGLDEIFRAVDRAIHMAFRRKVNDGARPMLRQQLANQSRIADIATHENKLRIILEGSEVFQVARVGQLVQADDGLILPRKPVQDKIRADKSGTACNQNHKTAFWATKPSVRISVKVNARKHVMPKLKFAPIKPAQPVTRIMFFCPVRGVLFQ